MKLVVVGGGMQGRVIAQNLLARPEKPEVAVADIRRPHDLPTDCQFVQADVLDAKQAKELVKGADAVVLAVPSPIAHQALENLVATGIAICDVSFTPDPPLSLDAAAKKSGSAVVVDCGVAPGLSHILVGAAHSELGGLDNARILVGGMPQNPPATFKHAIYFNPADLLAEYVRPARCRKNGKETSPAPLDVAYENYNDREVGQLQAFLSDGLRSLLQSYPDVPEMAEWTLRWPGHLESMETLRAIGLLQDEALPMVAKVIGNKFPAEQYPDFLLMVVEAARGKERRAWRLMDRVKNGESAMSRTTGYTTAAVAMLLARKQFTEPGVHAPERLGRHPELVKAVLNDLSERGVKVEELLTPATA